MCGFHPRFRVRVILIVEDSTVTVKCRTAIKALFLYFNSCLSVMFDSLSCSFIPISFLSNGSYFRKYRMLIDFIQIEERPDACYINQNPRK